MNPQTLALLGPQLLANIVADLSGFGLDVPARRVFSHGEPVYDGGCGLVAVWIQRLDTGPAPGNSGTASRPAQGLTNPPLVHITTWGVDLSVCAEERKAVPTAAEVTADGVAGAVWLWSLSRVLSTRWKDGTLFAPYKWSGGKAVVVSGGNPPNVSGGLIAVRAQVAMFTQDV